MIVISDSSPIILLIQVDQLQILNSLFGEVYIPEAVYKETTVEKQAKRLIDSLKWIKVEQVKNENAVMALQKLLDSGESEAIILALELQADYLLLDDLKARKIARQNQLTIVGVIGVLQLAKRAGLISEIKPILDTAISKFKFFISEKLYREVLNTEGET